MRTARAHALSALATLPLLAGLPGPARAVTFVVTNTDAAGAGSLAQAVADANDTPGADTIAFAIPGAGPHVIVTPGITLGDPVTIDGYTQPGASANTLAVGNDADLRIVLDGEETFLAGVGVRLLAGAAGSTIRGLSIVRHGTGSTGGGITSAGAVTVEGCWIGIDPSGAVLGNGGTGIAAGGASVVGGSAPAARNVVSTSGGVGIQVGGDGMRVQGNYVGTDPDGSGDAGNGASGVLVLGATNARIGGAAPGAGNLISGNGGDGITVQGPADGTVIEGNRVGAARVLALPLPNEGRGLLAVTPGALRVGPLATGDGPQAGLAIGGAGDGPDCCADLEERIAELEATGGNTFAYNRLGGATFDCLSTPQAGVLRGNGFLRNRSWGLESIDCILEAIRNAFAEDEAGATAAVGFGGQLRLDRNEVFDTPSPAHDNGGPFGPDGADPNDDGDVDAGANGKLNAALVESIDIVRGSQTAQLGISYAGAPVASTYRMQLYSNRGTADGRSALETFLQEAEITTDPQGRAARTLSIPHPSFATNSEVCVVVRDEAGNSSEEACARDGAPFGAHLRIRKTPDGGFVRPGEVTSFEVVVTNFGTEDVFDLEVRDQPLVSFDATAGLLRFLEPAEAPPVDANPGPGSGWSFQGDWSGCVENELYDPRDQVTDPFGSGLDPLFTCRLASLPAGASASFRIPMEALQGGAVTPISDAEAGTLVNRVQAFLGAERLGQDDGRVTVSAGADLGIAVSAPETANPLAAFALQVDVSNQGPLSSEQTWVGLTFRGEVFQALGLLSGRWFCSQGVEYDVLCQSADPIGPGQASGLQFRLRGRADAQGAHAINATVGDGRVPDFFPDDDVDGAIVRFGGAPPVDLVVDPTDAAVPTGADQAFSSWLCPRIGGVGLADLGPDGRPGTPDDDCSETAGAWAVVGGIGTVSPDYDTATTTFTAGAGGAGSVLARSGGLERAADVTVTPAVADSDDDGVPDDRDNCRLDPNPDQRDSNGDGLGNLCDPDLNDDGIVNFADLAILRLRFLGDDPDADLNGDGVVNFFELAVMRLRFLQPPGPGAAD